MLERMGVSNGARGHLRAGDWRRLVEAWRSVEPEGATALWTFEDRLLERAMALVGGERSFTIFAQKSAVIAPGDPLGGWRVAHHHGYGSSRERDEAVYELIRSGGYVADPRTREIVGRAGVVRTHVEDPRARDDGERHRALRAHPRIVTAQPLSPTLEVYVGVDRAGVRRRFSAHAALVLEELVRGLKGQLARLARTYGLWPGMQRLSPRERDALSRLLTHESEKEIAVALGLTERSTHQLVGVVYRKLGVRSRPELMTLWLGSPSRR